MVYLIKKMKIGNFQILNFIIKKNFKKIENNNDFKFDKKIELIDDFDHNHIILVNGVFKSCNLKFEEKEKLKLKA